MGGLHIYRWVDYIDMDGWITYIWMGGLHIYGWVDYIYMDGWITYI